MSDANTLETRVQNGFFDGLIARPIALFVIFITLLVVGVIAYRSIPIQMMPSGMVQPGLMVWVSHPGASAQEIKNAILESAVPTASLAGRTVTGGRLNVSGF